jgi:hypothetical protein
VTLLSPDAPIIQLFKARGEVVEVLMGPFGVEPHHPFGGGDFDMVDVAPGALSTDEFVLERADSGLGTPSSELHPGNRSRLRRQILSGGRGYTPQTGLHRSAADHPHGMRRLQWPKRMH